MLKPVTIVNSCRRCLATISPQKKVVEAGQFKDLTEKFVHKSCRVTVLGALSTTGKALSMLLKQNPLVSQIYLYDSSNTSHLAADLNHLDTNSLVWGSSKQDLHCSVRNADIIVALGLETIKADSSFDKKLNLEGKRLMELATAAALYAPKAIFVDCVVPLSLTLPIVSEVYRRNHWYHPGKVLGSVAQQQMRVNTMLAHEDEVDPSTVHVPLLGGPDEDIMLPLFSRASPTPVPLPEATEMINSFRNLEGHASPNARSNVQHEYVPYGNAYAINRLISTIALGLLGDSKALSTAFVRTNFIGACKHLVSTVKFGPHGIMHNYGVPKLTRFELRLFEKMTLELNRREIVARDFLERCACEALSRDTPAVSDPLHFPGSVNFYPMEDDNIVFEA